jgi:hypothetical protein
MATATLRPMTADFSFTERGIRLTRQRCKYVGTANSYQSLAPACAAPGCCGYRAQSSDCIRGIVSATCAIVAAPRAQRQEPRGARHHHDASRQLKSVINTLREVHGPRRCHAYYSAMLIMIMIMMMWFVLGCCNTRRRYVG